MAVTQLEDHGELHPDTHMAFLQCEMEAQPDVAAAIVTQLSMKAGLKAWGKGAEKAVKAEMKQMHLRETFVPKHWRELTDSQKREVLESHLFLKRKQDGTIKGRAVAGGNKQQDFMSKEDASSPMVCTEPVLLSSTIDAEERRDATLL